MADWGAGSFQSIIDELSAQQEKANLANEARYGQMMSIFDEIINRYKPGGGFEKAGLAEIEKGMKKGVGKESQQLISSGLYGTTTGAQVGQRWESEYAQPSKMKLEDVMMQRLSAAQLDKAGAIERREDIGPGYGTIASLAMQAAQGGGGGGGEAGGGGGQPKYLGGSVVPGGTWAGLQQTSPGWGAPAGAKAGELKEGEREITPQPLGLTANQLATYWGIGRGKEKGGRFAGMPAGSVLYAAGGGGGGTALTGQTGR